MMDYSNYELPVITNLKQQTGIYTTDGFRNEYSYLKTTVLVLLIFLLDIFTPVHAGLCFTANIRESELQLTCRFDTYEYPLAIRDPMSRTFASCDTINANLVCRLTQPYGKISSNYDNKTVTLMIPYKRGSKLDGKWTCDDGKMRQEMSIPYLEGSIEWTDTNIQGKVVTTNGKRRISISCSTCQNLKGNLVEFLINKTTNDFVRFVSISECYHHGGICKPQVCKCSFRGNSFTHLFEIPSNSSGDTIYTCVMHFNDRFNKEDFTIHSSLQFINGNFRQLETKKIVTRSGTNVPGIRTTRSSGTFSTTISIHSEHKTAGENWRFIVIGVGVPMFISLLFCGICIYLKFCERVKYINEKNYTHKQRDHDEETAFLHENDTDKQVETNQEKAKENNLVKLTRLITKIGMKVIRVYFDKNVLQKENLQTYLQQKKHLMFHALHPKRRCCNCLKENIDNNDRPVLLKSQFSHIYMMSDQIEQCKFCNKAQSICKLIPKKNILIDNLDLSILIGILSVDSTTKENRAILDDLIKVQRFSNDLIQFIGTGKLPTEQFEMKWKAVEDLLLNFANEIDINYGESINTEIQILYGDITEKTDEDFDDILSQWQNSLDLFSQQQEEMRFQKATEIYKGQKKSQLSSFKATFLVDKLEINLSTFEDESPVYHTVKGERCQEAIIRVGLPISWDLDTILTILHGKIEDINRGSKIKIAEKTSEDFIFVTNVPVDLVKDQHVFDSEMSKFFKDIVIRSGIDASCPAKIRSAFNIQWPFDEKWLKLL